MKRSVENENIERSYYQTAINQRIRRTLRVARACFAATLAGAVISGATKDVAPVAAVVPSTLIALSERKKSTNFMDKTVNDYARSIGSSRSSFSGEKAFIHEGKLHSVKYLDHRTSMDDLGFILAEQIGGTGAGIFAATLAEGYTPDAAKPGAIILASVLGVMAAGGVLMDSYSLKQSYNARLDNVEGVNALE